MNKYLFFTAILLATSGSFAQNRFAGQDRGGGRGVLCTNPDGSVQSLEVKDYHEARTTFSLDLDLGPADLHYKEKVAYVLERLAKTDVSLAQYLSKEVESFEAKTSFVDAGGIRMVDDVSEGDLTLPNNCREVQMAVNKLNPLPFEKTFLIDVSFWNIADNDTKAGLVLHEMVYLLTRHLGETKSDKARYMNALISSKQIGSFVGCQYSDLLLKKMNWKIEAPIFSTKAPGGGFFTVSAAHVPHMNNFYPYYRCNDNYVEGLYLEPQDLKLKFGDIKASSAEFSLNKLRTLYIESANNLRVSFKSGYAHLLDRSRLGLHPDGSVRMLFTKEAAVTIFGLKYSWNRSQLKDERVYLAFNEKQEVTRADFPARTIYLGGEKWVVTAVKSGDQGGATYHVTAPFPKALQKKLTKQYGRFFGRPIVDNTETYEVTYKGGVLTDASMVYHSF